MFCHEYQLISPAFKKSGVAMKKSHLYPSNKSKITGHQYSYYSAAIDISQAHEKFCIDYADIAKYIRLKVPGFIDLVVRFIYEQNDIDPNLRMFYITLIKSIIVNEHSFNAVFLANDQTVLRLLLGLRLEKEENIKKETAKVLFFTFKHYSTTPQLKALFGLMLKSLGLEDFLNAFFGKTPNDYSKEAIETMRISFDNKENYLETLKCLLKLVKNLLKTPIEPPLEEQLPEKPIENMLERPVKTLNFSGSNSGIVFTNLRFPIKAFSIYIEFSLDNLLTPSRADLQGLYHKTDDPVSGNLFQDPLVSSKWPEKKMQLDSQHFAVGSTNNSPINKKRHMNSKIASVSSDSLNKLQKGYCPRLFALRSIDGNASLEIYINEYRHLNIELIDKSRVLDTFNIKFDESHDYSLLITFTQDLNFRVFNRGMELDSNHYTFPSLLEKFQYPKYFSIGCSPEMNRSPKHNNGRDMKQGFKLENCLSGTIFGLKIVDKVINPSEKIEKIMFKSLNLSLFEFMEKNSFPISSSWQSLGKNDPSSMDSQQIFPEITEKISFFNNMLSILHIGSEKTPKNTDKPSNFEVKCRGVSQLERADFLDFFLRFGNVEVLFLLIEAAGNNAELGEIEADKRF